ncbi:mucoidy inhibitor A [Mycena olivaceomarginata]|nr:mucoidy inhibitor A [Mycena olivaceomarginata]
MSADHPPPAFEPLSSIELNSGTDSVIVGVTLYPSRAEVTRRYALSVKTGLNQVKIGGLPSVFDTRSLRASVEGAATIHDVTASTERGRRESLTSAGLTALLRSRQSARDSLQTYITSITAQALPVAELAGSIEEYESAGIKVDSRRAELSEQLEKLDKDIQEERARLNKRHLENDTLRASVVLSLFAEAAGDVEMTLIYGVFCASWKARYDIRVDTNTNVDTKDAKSPSVAVTFKADVQQSTGEAWTDVPLTLATADTVMVENEPNLPPWTLGINWTLAGAASPTAISAFSRPASPTFISPMPYIPDIRRAPPDARCRRGVNRSLSRSRSRSSSPSRDQCNTLPGAAPQTLTVGQGTPRAEMSWVAAPKVDNRVNLNAEIARASVEDAFLAFGGPADVYINGEFVSSCQCARAGLNESFLCPLGLPPQRRHFHPITYPPVRTTTTALAPTKDKFSLFKRKSPECHPATHYRYLQHITVRNDKISTPVTRLKIVDQIPVANDAQIRMKLLNPPLPLPAFKSSNAGHNGDGVLRRLGAALGLISKPNPKSDAPWQWSEPLVHNYKQVMLDASEGASGAVDLTLEWEVVLTSMSGWNGMTPQIYGL